MPTIVQQPKYNITQGEDEQIKVPIIINSESLDLTNCTNIIAILRTGNNPQQVKFALSGSSGVNTLEIDTVQNNLLKLNLTREDSKSLLPGAIFCDLVIEFQDDNFPSGKHKEITNISIGMLREGKLKDEVV